MNKNNSGVLKSHTDGVSCEEDRQLYIRQKRGKGYRYYPVARFDGFPSDGVWIVESSNSGSRASLIALPETVEAIKQGDLPESFVMDRAALDRRMNEVCKAMQKIRKSGAVSDVDLVSAIFDVLAQPQKKDIDSF